MLYPRSATAIPLNRYVHHTTQRLPGFTCFILQKLAIRFLLLLLRDLDHDTMTLIYKLDLTILKMYL